MNFLAHYMLANQIDSPEFHSGAILPDIARKAGFRILPCHLKHSAGLHAELAAGIRLHWYSDKLFHQSGLFLRGYEIWEENLRFEHQPAGRRYFLFHLLAEMWLDRLLLAAWEKEAVRFYSSLAYLDESKLQPLSRQFSDAEGNLWKTFQDFQSRRFIQDYADPDRFANIAARVFAHAGRQDFSSLLKDEIRICLPELACRSDEMLMLWGEFSEKLRNKWKNSELQF